jgi:hypothetical protein
MKHLLINSRDEGIDPFTIKLDELSEKGWKVVSIWSEASTSKQFDNTIYHAFLRKEVERHSKSGEVHLLQEDVPQWQGRQEGVVFNKHLKERNE